MAAEELELITSTANRRIVTLRKLEDRKERRQQGRFRVEGLQALHMALDAGARPLEVFYCEELFDGMEAASLLKRFRQTGASLVPVSKHVMESLSDREAPQGLVVTFARLERSLESVVLPERCLVLVLDRLQDPGNLGTLLRTADAVGAALVVLLEPGVDPYEPRAVRSSMGSLFNLPLVLSSDVTGVLAQLQARGLRLLGAHAHEGELWGKAVWGGSVALVLGNEARGLSPDVAAGIQRWVHLPMVGKADSLNVSIAGGVLMYAWLRENLEK